MTKSILLLSALAAVFPTLCSAAPSPSYRNKASNSSAVVNSTVCNGQSYVYESLAGYGLVPSNARDKYGDTLGGLGSSIAFDKKSWRASANGSSYTGILWTLPGK